jgi:pimeloyl-ACP methyl ester carboxylesterase
VLLESSLALWNELADADLVILQRSGHLPFREEPDAFAAAVVEFLESL